jgi:hypothetical protein
METYKAILPELKKSEYLLRKAPFIKIPFEPPLSVFIPNTTADEGGVNWPKWQREVRVSRRPAVKRNHGHTALDQKMKAFSEAVGQPFDSNDYTLQRTRTPEKTSGTTLPLIREVEETFHTPSAPAKIIFQSVRPVIRRPRRAPKNVTAPD